MVVHHYNLTGLGGEGEMEMPIGQWLRWQVDGNFSLIKDLGVLALLSVPGIFSWAPTGISMNFINKYKQVGEPILLTCRNMNIPGAFAAPDVASNTW